MAHAQLSILDTRQINPGLPGLAVALSELIAEARQRAEEFEQRRSLAPDFADRLKRAGLFRFLLPVEGGGLGGSLRQWLDMLIALAEADASTGWVCAHGATCSTLIHALAEPGLRDTFFADANACAAWSNLPRVEVTEQPDGLRISGSWSFATGATLATYVGGMVQLPPKPDGRPRAVVALVPAEQARIRDTWDPVGLAGTGSHDVVFENVFLPWAQIFEWPAGSARCAYPLAALAASSWFIAIGAAATHLGLARQALDEARSELAGKKDRYTGKPLLENAATLRRLEAAEGLWFACRAGLREALDAIWQAALRGEAPSTAQRLDARVAAVTAVQQCAALVREAYDCAGASAVSRKGVLQRLLRDASCLTHHITACEASFEITGRVRCGIDKPTFRI